MGYRGRDVEVTFANDVGLVVACDSCGAIGEKELDVVRVPAGLTGRFAARVALLEVLATGAKPQIVTAAICNEPEPTGGKLLEGVKDELESAGLGTLPIAISCEKNMSTRQTGLGITVVGLVDAAALRIAGTRDGDSLYCLGMPQVGPEVQDADDPEVVRAGDVRRLLEDPSVHDIIPVGSRGILGEIRQLVEVMELAFAAGEQKLAGEFSDKNKIPVGSPDIHKSGGPATCLIFSAAPAFAPESFLGGKHSSSSAPLFYLGQVFAQSGVDVNS